MDKHHINLSATALAAIAVSLGIGLLWGWAAHSDFILDVGWFVSPILILVLAGFLVARSTPRGS